MGTPPSEHASAYTRRQGYGRRRQGFLSAAAAAAVKTQALFASVICLMSFNASMASHPLSATISAALINDDSASVRNMVLHEASQKKSKKLFYLDPGVYQILLLRQP